MTASHKILTLQALSSSLNAGTAKRGCLSRGRAFGPSFGSPPAVCPPERPCPFAPYRVARSARHNTKDRRKGSFGKGLSKVSILYRDWGPENLFSRRPARISPHPKNLSRPDLLQSPGKNTPPCRNAGTPRNYPQNTEKYPKIPKCPVGAFFSVFWGIFLGFQNFSPGETGNSGSGHLRAL